MGGTRHRVSYMGLLELCRGGCHPKLIHVSQLPFFT